MEIPDWNPGSLLETSGSYWRTCTLHTSVKLDIFTIIGSQSMTSLQIAKQLNAPEKGVTVLLNALSAMGLLKKKSNSYTNSEAGSAFLSKDSPHYIGFMIMHHHHLVESWFKMDKAIMEGTPVRERTSFSDEQRRESFLMGMFNIAMAIAPRLSEEIDLSGCRHLIDLGGGPGTFAIHFCMANPELTAEVFDLPTTKPFAQKTIEKFNLADRVSFSSGNYIEDEVLSNKTFDAAWLSHILHGEGPEDAERIIKKTADIMKTKGKIFIHEFILNRNMDGPLFPALFSINMFLGTENGQSYSEDQLFSMLENSGFHQIKRLDFTGPTQSGIICGIKK